MDPFEYAVIRVIPSIERGELINAGVVLYCQKRQFLGARTRLDEARLLALAPSIDVAAVAAVVDAWQHTCVGEGVTKEMKLGERFRWLTAPRSTIVQPGPVHTGLTADPKAELERLLTVLVA
jgi:hypothetical protein